MRKIIYLHQHFKLPTEPGGTRSYWIAQELIKNGYEVVILTASGTIKDALKIIQVDGLKIVYFREDYDQNMGFVRRLKAFVSFMFKSSVYLFRQKDVDLVFATSTPLTIGVPALFLRWIKKTSYVFEVRDLWPEVPIQMGAIRNPILKSGTRWLEKIVYRNAEHVIALSPGMQDGVVKYISKEKTSMIPNMSKIDEFWPRDIDYDFISSLGLSLSTFKVVHFGSLGIANGAETIIESAKLLKDDNSIEFIFIGGGSTENQLREQVVRNGLKNVRFLGNFPMKQTSEIVNACDVSIVSFKKLPILSTNSPNKLFDSLSAGKPIIVNSSGWTKDLVENYYCGYYVDPDKPSELADKLLLLKNNPSLVRQMGDNARQLAEKKYDKSILTKEVVTVLSNCIKFQASK